MYRVSEDMLPVVTTAMHPEHRPATTPNPPGALRSRVLVVGLWALTLAVPRGLRGADRIILRNLDVISDKSVVGFDVDGVRMDDATVITWDEIERGRTSPAQQAEFDQLLARLGTPLYRIRQRLSVGDYRGLFEEAEALYPAYAGRSSQTAYMVGQALMWARLAAGQREAAVEPYLRCYTWLRTVEAAKIDLPGSRRLRFDPQTGMCPDLLPIWFDGDAAQAALPGVLAAISEMPPPRPESTRVYYGTLALAAGQVDRGHAVLQGIEGQHPLLAELRTIAAAQHELQTGRPGAAITALAAQADSVSAANRPLVLYCLGMAKLAGDDAVVQRDGILQLLHLPALYSRQAPDLAAAALYHSMRVFAAWDDADAQLALRRELIEQYSQTYHAAKLMAAETDGQPPENPQ
jgi:hypothetical protein